MNGEALTIKDLRPLLAEIGERHALIRKLDIFGSVADGSASTESDLDILVTFRDEAPRDSRYIDLFVQLRQELQAEVGCKVDLIDRNALRDDVFGFNAVQNLKTVYERL